MPESGLLIWIAIVAALWPLVVLACRALLDTTPGGEVEAVLFYALLRTYVRFVHRLRVIGAGNIPRARRGVRFPNGPGSSGPLIVVANHTAGVDPVLIQY